MSIERFFSNYAIIMDEILKLFPSLTAAQIEQFNRMGDLYRFWNERINVISRKDIDNIYLHHVVHSLTIARFLGDLTPGTGILDMGTGGGFPGIPLAVVFPDVRFHLIDRIGKKIRVCNEVASELGLKNITTQHGDIGECHKKFDYVVSRAVMRLDSLVPLVRRNVSSTNRNSLHNGLICLKGGELDPEISATKLNVEVFPLNEFVSDSFFENKYLIYVPM